MDKFHKSWSHASLAAPVTARVGGNLIGHKKSSEEPFQKLPVVNWKVPHTNKVQKLYLL
jgi:hypothetical protein